MPCRAVAIFSALQMSQQYDIIIGKHFWVSPLPTEASNTLSVNRLSSCKKDEISSLVSGGSLFAHLFKIFAVQTPPETSHLTI